MTTAPTAPPELLDLDKLEALARAANPGPWKWWTSNSVLRLSAADGIDGGVLHAYSHRGHADICCGESDRAFIAAANPAGVLALIALARAALAHQPAQEQASTTRVTETKRMQLEARGYEVVGYVMQNSVNELCTLAHGRVEWLGKPAQATQQEPVAALGSIGDLTEFHVLLNWYDNEASYGSINEGRNKLTKYIDKWADRRAAQLDGGQGEGQ